MQTRLIVRADATACARMIACSCAPILVWLRRDSAIAASVGRASALPASPVAKAEVSALAASPVAKADASALSSRIACSCASILVWLRRDSAIASARASESALAACPPKTTDSTSAFAASLVARAETSALSCWSIYTCASSSAWLRCATSNLACIASAFAPNAPRNVLSRLVLDDISSCFWLNRNEL